MASRKSSRKQLQHIDREILKLVDQRAEVYKSLEQQGKLPPPETIFNTSVNFTAKRRLKNFKYNNLKHIFREINSECYNAARPLKITYLGPEGTFTNLAAVKHFGNAARFIAANSISAVFNTISNRKADFGVVPIENNTEGMVNYTLDMFQVTSVFIHSEFQLPINLYLLSKEKNSKAVKTIYSHPQPLAQCRSYLENNFHRIKLVETVSTSEAAAIASRRKNAAAIAALSACHQHKLNILAEQIEDASDNKTRFIVISGKLFTEKKKTARHPFFFPCVTNREL